MISYSLHKLKEYYSYPLLDKEAGLETSRFLSAIRIGTGTEFKSWVGKPSSSSQCCVPRTCRAGVNRGHNGKRPDVPRASVICQAFTDILTSL